MKTICICGGGNLGLVCAGVFASQGYNVRLLTGHPERWSHNIDVFDNDGRCFSGKLERISSSAEDVIPESDIVLLCLPGYLIERTLRDIAPYLGESTPVGSIVSSTGFFFFAHSILPQHPIFGFQRVPYICRVKEYGKVGLLLGYKKSLNVAVENIENAEEFIELLGKMFMTPVVRLDSFYEAALTNSNPILHTARLYSMWANDCAPVCVQPYFYADWTNETSRLMIEMDNEFMAILAALNVKPGAVPSLLEYYESTDAESLTRKIKSIEAFKSLLAPMKHIPDGWIPDFESRYFTEDFPFGLRFIKDLSEQLGISTPAIDKVYAWGISKINQ